MEKILNIKTKGKPLEGYQDPCPKNYQTKTSTKKCFGVKFKRTATHHMQTPLKAYESLQKETCISIGDFVGLASTLQVGLVSNSCVWIGFNHFLDWNSKSLLNLNSNHFAYKKDCKSQL